MSSTTMDDDEGGDSQKWQESLLTAHISLQNLENQGGYSNGGLNNKLQPPAHYVSFQIRESNTGRRK